MNGTCSNSGTTRNKYLDTKHYKTAWNEVEC